MSSQPFCPNCGSPRLPGARFCSACGHALDADGAPPPSSGPTPPTATNAAGNTALLAGLSWLVAAALTGYLAYQQWSLSRELSALGLGDEGLGAYAGWNAIAAVITLFFGARLLTTPTRRLLDASAAWAVLSVIGGVLQIASSGSNDVFALGTIAAAVAGVLSFVGRQAFPVVGERSKSQVVPGWQSESVPTIVPSPPLTANAAAVPPTASSSRTAERVVIVLIIVAVLGGGALLLARQQADQTLADVASFLATARPTTLRTTPIPQNASTAGLGEIVDLVDGDGADLGSVRVIKNGKPSELLGLTPASGNRYIAALVNYTARAAWSYNLFDWAAHDSRQIQYEPLGLAPNPALEYGTLSAGRQVEAWVAFEIPATVRDVWLDFRSGGEVIFTVKID